VSSVNKVWYVYLLQCQNGSLYTGITTDVARRFAKHGSGKGAKFTRSNPPQKILAATPCANRAEASKLEWRVKTLTPIQKRALAAEWPLQEGLPVL
jgi:putative endonuclease